jgi:hypothetical protein
MQNLIFHISLPKGLKLVNGSVLMKDVTFDFISQITPYYSTIDMVRLAAGPTLRKLSDITIACQIFQSSQEANLVSPLHLPQLGERWVRYIGSRMQYTTALAARDLTLNVTDLLGANAHVLANFSVDRKADNTKRLAEFNDSIKFYEPTLRSGGRVMPGGRPGFEMAAKGVLDWTERTPGRTWFGNGMGANSTSFDMGSSTGGRGKPVKFFSSPMFSPPMSSMRIGMCQSGFPISPLYSSLSVL